MNLNKFNYYDIARLDQTDNLYVYLFSDTELSSLFVDGRISESVLWLESECNEFISRFVENQEERRRQNEGYVEPPPMDEDYHEPEYSSSVWASFDWGEKFAIDPERAEDEISRDSMYSEKEEIERFNSDRNWKIFQARNRESGAFGQLGLNIDEITIVSFSRRFIHSWSKYFDHLEINSLLEVILYIPPSGMWEIEMYGLEQYVDTNHWNDSFLMKSVFWEVSEDVFMGLIYNEIYLITLIAEPKDVLEYWKRFFNSEFFEVKHFQYASSLFHVNLKMYSTRKTKIIL
jgi:hypothetical protein